MTKRRRRRRRRILVIKNEKILRLIFFISIISLLYNAFSIYHFMSFNHNKIQTEKIVPENILFLGDSITDEYDLDKYYNKYNTVNSGISGDTTKEILDDMKGRVYNYNPSKVFLLIGTNDLNLKRSSESIVKNIKEIIDGIKEKRSNAEIYVESVYPINKDDDDKIDFEMVGIRTNKKIKNLNSKIKELCDDEKITYIDMFSVLVNKDGMLDLKYTRDGLHMSEDGYKVITNKLKEYLK